MEWGEEVGDGRAEESSAIGDGEQAAMLVTPDVNGLSVHIFESLQLEDSDLGDLLYNHMQVVTTLLDSTALENSPWGCYSQTQLSDFTFTFHFHALEKEMATHSSVLAWRIPGMGKPGGLPSMGSHRVGHD